MVHNLKSWVETFLREKIEVELKLETMKVGKTYIEAYQLSRIYTHLLWERWYVHSKQNIIFVWQTHSSQLTYATAPKNLVIIVGSISSTVKLACCIKDLDF